MRMLQKILKALLAIFALVVLVYITALVYVLSFSLKKNIPLHADAAIILGAKVNLDNTPSESLLYRTDEAIKLYKQGKVDYIIATGGQGLGYVPESTTAERIAEEQGVPGSKIFREADSHNTFDNVKDILPIAQKNQIHSVVVVSDEYHVPRGVMVVRHFGFAPVYWDYPPIGYYTKTEIVWNYLREAAAVISYIPKMFSNN